MELKTMIIKTILMFLFLQRSIQFVKSSSVVSEITTTEININEINTTDIVINETTTQPDINTTDVVINETTTQPDINTTDVVINETTTQPDINTTDIVINETTTQPEINTTDTIINETTSQSEITTTTISLTTETSTTSVLTTPTTTLSTTTVRPTTPPPPKPDDKEPDWGSKSFDIALSIKYSLLEDEVDDPDKVLIHADVKRSLEEVYQPSSNMGFSHIEIIDSCIVGQSCSVPSQSQNSHFINTSPSESCLELPQSQNIYDTSSNTSVITHYTAVYKMQYVLQWNITAEEIISFIWYNVTGELTENGIGGRTVDGNYSETICEELKQQSVKLDEAISNPCSFDDSLCEYGYWCNPETIGIMYCKPICYAAEDQDAHICCGITNENNQPEHCAYENEICETTGQESMQDYMCSCVDDYIYFGAFSCANKVVVIASLSTIIGVVVLALLISTIVLSVKLRKTPTKESTKHDFKSLNGSRDGLHLPLNDYENDYEDENTRGRENSGFSHFERPSPNSAFDLPLSKQFTTENGNGNSSVSRDFKHGGHKASDHRYSTFAAEPKDIPFEQLYSDIAESEVYQNFKPQLDNIDTKTNFFANRPAINIKSKQKHDNNDARRESAFGWNDST